MDHAGVDAPCVGSQSRYFGIISTLWAIDDDGISVTGECFDKQQSCGRRREGKRQDQLVGIR